MTVTVRPEGSEPEAELVEPVGPASPLALLRGKRAALEASLHLDLAVPRWEEVLGRRLWVRYRPANPAVLAAASAKREKSHQAALAKGTRGDPDWTIKANADMLVDACVAVYDLGLDEKPPEGSLDGALPTFSSPELSEAVGASPNAVETALKVYMTSADLMVAANQLLAWSAQESKEVSTAFLDG